MSRIKIQTHNGPQIYLNPEHVEAIHGAPMRGASDRYLCVLDMVSGTHWHVEGTEAEINDYDLQGKPRPAAPAAPSPKKRAKRS